MLQKHLRRKRLVEISGGKFARPSSHAHSRCASANMLAIRGWFWNFLFIVKRKVGRLSGSSRPASSELVRIRRISVPQRKPGLNKQNRLAARELSQARNVCPPFLLILCVVHRHGGLSEYDPLSVRFSYRFLEDAMWCLHSVKRSFPSSDGRSRRISPRALSEPSCEWGESPCPLSRAGSRGRS